MIDDKEIDDARRMLVVLLAQPDDVVEGLEELTMRDKLFLLSTCSAKMIEVAVCAIAMFNAEDALEGLDALMASTREHIRQRCERVQ